MRVLPAFLLALVPAVAAFTWVRAPEVRRISSVVGDTVVATSYESRTGRSDTPVILVPGLLGSSYTFRGLAPRLADAGYDVVIIEPLGFGVSSRPKGGDYTLEAQAARIGDALDSLGIDNAQFVCHSVGASMCMRLSLQRPALTHGIISINGGPDEAAATSGLRMSLKMAPLLKVFGAQRIIRGKIKDGLRETAADPSWVTDEVTRGYTAYYADFNSVQTSFRGMVNARERTPLQPRLSQITAPVTLLVGAGRPQKVITPADVKILSQSIRHLKIDSVAGAGQFIQEEKPDAIVEAVREQRRRQ